MIDKNQEKNLLIPLVSIPKSAISIEEFYKKKPLVLVMAF
jgi:hypothetical protein